MNKKSIEILESIIASKGNCDDRTPAECSLCPIGQLKRHPNGSPMGCIESLQIVDLKESDADDRYLQTALSLLADIRFDEILEDNGDADQ